MTAGSPVTSEMVGRICPYCRFGLEEGLGVIACSVCKAIHHDDCWEENGGCVVALCAGGPSLEATPQEGAQQVEPPPLPAPAPTPTPLPAVVPPGPSEAPTQKSARPHSTLPSPGAAPPPPPGPPLAQGRPSRSRWVPLIAAGIILLGGAGAAAIVLTEHGSGSSETVSAGTGDTSGPAGGEEDGFEAGGGEAGEPEEGEGFEPSPTPGQLAQGQIQHALTVHFDHLASGNYEDAYYDLTSREGEEIGGESAWVAAQEEDQLQSFTLTVDTSLADPHTAKATIVEFETHALATGCKDWFGYWEMSKVYGEWLISSAKLEKEPC